MKITLRSPFSGRENTVDIPVTEQELARIRSGEAIQAVVPHLPADHREFLMTGITAAEWSRYVGEEDE